MRNFAPMLSFRHIIVSLLSIFILSNSTVVASEPHTVSVDSVSQSKRKGIIRSLIDYFDKSNKKDLTTKPDFTPLGGPHFSSEKGLGLGLVIAGDYSTCPSDSTLPASNISLKGDIATKGYYSVGITGAHIFPSNSRRINYDLDFQSFATYFWGIGYDWGNDNGNKTKYNLFDLTLSADYEWRLAPGLYLGPAIEISYTNAHNITDYTPWQGQKTHYIITSIGARLQYDLRDNLTFPHRGVLLELIQLFSPQLLGNGNRAFFSTEVAYNLYTPIWKGAVLATRLHAKWTFGHTPWSKLPFLGGNSMRAYYEGRYRDKCATDLTVELRQHVYRRSGIAIWSGVRTVSRHLSDIAWKRLLPEFGVGYRWEFKKNSNVRIDVGFGKHSSGFMFGLNESF